MSRVLAAFATATVAAAVAQFGIADTVGGTIYDWQLNGPALRTLVSSGPFGLHSLWVYSDDTTGAQPDRNMRYNFYDYASRMWNWPDPDFMLAGVGVYVERSGFGNLAAYPESGMAVVLAHINAGGNPQPCAARDIDAGAGIFEYCPGPVGCLWPVAGVTQTGTVHVAFVDNASQDGLWYARIREWCNWDTVVGMGVPSPMYPAHNLAASRNGTKVCVTWTVADVFPYRAYYRISENDGDTWGPVTELEPPPAFGPDTGFSYFITSPFPLYNEDSRLHIVVDGMPIIRGTAFQWPNEIWHWCPDNTPQWSRVHRAGGDHHGQYEPGVNALMACRPSIGDGRFGNLFVTWEQFDTLNVEPLTGLLRADIWVTGSEDNGVSWIPALRVTTPNNCSKRFPCISDLTIPGYPYGDAVAIQYMVDQVAGFRAGGSPTGPWTYNPVFVHKTPVSVFFPMGVAEPAPAGREEHLRLSVAPNPAGQRAAFSYSVPTLGEVSLSVYDASGRLVRALVSGRRPAGRHVDVWDADVPAGVYVCTLVSGASRVSRKVVVKQ